MRILKPAERHLFSIRQNSDSSTGPKSINYLESRVCMDSTVGTTHGTEYNKWLQLFFIEIFLIRSFITTQVYWLVFVKEIHKFLW